MPELNQDFATEVKTHGTPTEMGFRLDVHSSVINISIEIDLDGDPMAMQAIMTAVPEVLLHYLEQATTADSPHSAHEWWADGAQRLGDFRGMTVVKTNADSSIGQDGE